MAPLPTSLRTSPVRATGLSSPASNGLCTSASGANWSAYSLQGSRRERNSDAFAVFDRDGLQVFAVGDGVGSLPGSPVASRAAVDAVVSATELGLIDLEPPVFAETLELVKESVSFALHVEELQGATTLALVVLNGDRKLIASVGDSEVHEVAAEGPSALLHSLDHVPSRPNVLLAWIDGQADVELHVASPSAAAEFICLMSDGVPGALSPDEIASIVRRVGIENGGRELVLAARRAGATDDLTAVVVRSRPHRTDS